MKKIVPVLIFTLLLSFTTFANEKTLESKVKDVTIFLNGAQVNRTTNTSTIDAGTTEIILNNLSPNIDQNSIQVTGKGDFTILSVTNNHNFLSNSKKPKEILVLEDSLNYFKNLLDNSQIESSVYKDEKTMILALGKTGEKKAAEIEAIANLYRTRILDLNKKIHASSKKEADLNERINKTQQQLNSLNNNRNKPTSDIVITVSSKTKTTCEFDVSYYSYNASWNAVYELRAKDVEEPIQLTYKANINQNTGEQWENVLVTLSTGNPTQNSNKPNLNPWRLDFNEYRIQSRSYSKQIQNDGIALYEAAAPSKAESSADYTTVTQSELATEFKIDLKQTILSNSKTHVVEIQKHTLPAYYTFYAAPKIDKDAFLLAKITGWEEYNLLAGEATIFYKGTYVGKSHINTNSANDTLDISLGRDKDIKIERTKIKDYTKKKTFGSNKKETQAWDIVVRNNKNKVIDLVLEDQIPVSGNNAIEVETENMSGAKLNTETGLLTWKLNLEASKTKSLKLIYSVKYPSDKNIPNF